MSMNGFKPVDKVPPKRMGKRSHLETLVSFLESDCGIVAKEYGSSKECKSAYFSLKQFAKRKSIPVKVAMRGNTVFLEKEGE